MHAADILKYGHRTIVQTIADLPVDAWEMPGACGVWSCKDIIAHLASFEHVLVDILATFLGSDPTPSLDQFRDPHGDFNDAQVVLRKRNPVGDILAEYRDTCAQTMQLIGRIPAETLRQSGTIPWYGTEYALDALIVYMYYGHKREHPPSSRPFATSWRTCKRVSRGESAMGRGVRTEQPNARSRRRIAPGFLCQSGLV